LGCGVSRRSLAVHRCHNLFGAEMSEPINETYNIKIVRNGRDFSAIEYNFPADDFGKKMMAILLYQIGEHIDPAFRAGFGDQPIEEEK
jgi:hypothetical protein